MDTISNSVDFIGIGAARSGSSWLWKQLRRHQEIWMPPVKELHYFDRDPSYPSPSYLSPDSIFERLTGQARHNQQYRRRLLKELVKDVVWFRPTNLTWTYRYFFKPCSIGWYKSLFEPGGNRLKGEITPAYSILEHNDVASIADTFPDLKILFLIRNPIYRAWSHAKYDYTTGKLSDLTDVGEVKALVEKPVQELRSDYLRTYRIWADVFGKEQVYLDFYDRIQKSPEKLLGDVGEFLGLTDPDGLHEEEKSDRRVNSSPKSEMPEEIRGYLTQKYLGDLREMADTFGGCAEKWVARASSSI